MKAPRLILSLRLSQCCGSKAILVRSREGNFVSQGCLSCGNPEYVSEIHIPDLDCESCKLPQGCITVTVINKNYVYKCEGCRKEWELGAILPDWSDLFPYCGLAAPGDPGFPR
jgi:hypothetical protein